MNKQKTSILSVVALLFLIGGFITSGQIFVQPALAGTNSCIGQPATQTADAPTSVKQGQSFSLKNVSQLGDTLIATVKASDMTFFVTNATPSSFTMTWTGSQTGAFNINYGTQSLKATGKAGDEIIISIKSIASTVNVGGPDLNVLCDVADNSLTADEPGESFILARIPIKAATTSSPSSPSNTPDTSTPTSNTTNTPTTTTNTGTTENSSSSEQTTNNANNKQTSGKLTDVKVEVLDNNGNPVEGALVILDSRTGIPTNQKGIARIKDVTEGEHDLTIISQERANTEKRTIDVVAKKGEVFGVTVDLPPANQTGKILRGVKAAVPFVIGALVLFVGYRMTRRFMRHRFKAPKVNPEATQNFVQYSPQEQYLPGQHPVSQPVEPTYGPPEPMPSQTVEQPAQQAQQPAPPPQPQAPQPGQPPQPGQTIQPQAQPPQNPSDQSPLEPPVF